MNSLARFEETSLSILFRESGFAFFSTLSVHALAMAIVVGTNVVICLNLVLSSTIENKRSYRPFYQLHWWAVGFIFVSGVLLLVAYPAKALTNPVFYLKFAALTQGLLAARYFHLFLSEENEDNTIPARIKVFSLYALLLWAITIATGRFLAYTHTILLASSFY